MSTSVKNDLGSDLAPRNTVDTTAIKPAKLWLWDLSFLYLPIIGLSPLLVLHGLQLWSRPAFKFYPLAIIVLTFGFFLSEKGISTVYSRRVLSASVALLAFVFGIYSAIVFAPSIAFFSIGLFIVAWGSVRLPRSSIGRTLAVAMLVFSLIPLPLNMDNRVENWLNNIAASLSTNILDVFQVFCLLQFPYLALESTTINYIDYLSNSFSIRAVMCFALFLIVVKRRALLAGMLAISSGLGCTLIGKVLLLTGAALMANAGVVWNQGIGWTLLPWAIAIFSLILVLIFESMWGALLEPIRTAGDVLSIDRTRSANVYNRMVYWPGTITYRRNRDSTVENSMDSIVGRSALKQTPFFGWVALAFALAMLAFPLAMAIQRQGLLFNSINAITLSPDKLPNSSTFAPGILPGLNLNQYQNNSAGAMNRGTQVHLWSYSGISADAKIVLLYPVGGWSSTWSLGDDEEWKFSSKIETSTSDAWPFIEDNLTADTGNSTKLAKFYSSQFTVEGRPYSPTPQELEDTKETKPTNRLFELRLLRYLKDSPEEQLGKRLVIQMLYETREPLQLSEEEALRKIYLAIRDVILRKIASSE